MARRCVVGAALLIITGCGFPAAKLDEAKGHVRGALEVWQKGGKPEDLMSAAPPVEFHEAMWKAGEKLTAFEMGEVKYVDSAQVVRCDVKLTVRGRNGRDRTENVVYDVTLGPPVKVLNNPMP